jgi:hypothetical protein
VRTAAGVINAVSASRMFRRGILRVVEVSKKTRGVLTELDKLSATRDPNRRTAIKETLAKLTFGDEWTISPGHNHAQRG